MNLSAEQLLSNYQKLMTFIEMNFSGVRREKLLSLHSDWGTRISTSPASSKKQYHNGFPGGYVLHVLNVLEVAPQIMSMWSLLVGELDFTREELLFSALTHDLGKIGNEEEDYYIECTEDWLIRKGQIYTHNPKLQYMKVADRSLMNLYNRGITMTDKEYLAIKLHDGMYEDANKPYLISYNEDYELKTCLPHVLHQADFMSAKCESMLTKKGTAVKKTTATSNGQAKYASTSAVKTPRGALDKFLTE